MTRTMYDSTTASDIPMNARMVAGYVDGWYRWRDEDWARFPYATKVRIAIHAATNDGHVLDVEQGAAEPADVPSWLSRRRSVGLDPTVYVNRANWQECKDACGRAGIPQPHWWLAAYDGVPEVPEGTVAKQYANEAITGSHYDLSAVADFWPGVDGETMTPQRVGQSADITLKPGEIGLLQAFFEYGGTTRNIQRKVWSHKAGRNVYTVYPPVDPDADPTECLDAEPAIFIVDITPA